MPWSSRVNARLVELAEIGTARRAVDPSQPVEVPWEHFVARRT